MTPVLVVDKPIAIASDTNLPGDETYMDKLLSPGSG